MLFSIPGLVKGTADTVTLNKSELLSLAPVAADEFFSDGANIQLVIAEWNSNPGSQREVAIFKFSDATPSHEFLVSESAQDVFELEQLILVDFDNGELRLDRAALDAAISGGVEQFDIDFSVGGGGGPTLSVTSGLHWWFKADSLALADGASVTSWADEQGGLALTTYGTSPSYVASSINGKPAVRSTYNNEATQQALSMSRGIPSTFTAMIVMKRLSGGPATQLVWDATASGSNTPKAFLLFDGSTLQAQANSSWFGVIQNIGTVGAPSDAVIAGMTVQASEFKGYLNGVLKFTQAGTYTTGDNTMLALFGLGWAPQIGFKGDVAEFIVFNRVLTTQESADVHAYLGAKYAITVA